MQVTLAMASHLFRPFDILFTIGCHKGQFNIRSFVSASETFPPVVLSDEQLGMAHCSGHCPPKRIDFKPGAVAGERSELAVGVADMMHSLDLQPTGILDDPEVVESIRQARDDVQNASEAELDAYEFDLEVQLSTFLAYS